MLFLKCGNGYKEKGKNCSHHKGIQNVFEDGLGQCHIRKSQVGIRLHTGIMLLRIRKKKSCEPFVSCGGYVELVEEQMG